MPTVSPSPRVPPRAARRAALVASSAASLAALVAAPAHAQWRGAWDAQVGAAHAPAPATATDVAGAADGGWAAGRTLGAQLRFDAPLARLGVGGALGGAGAGWRGTGDVSAALATPAWRGLRLGAGAAGRAGNAGGVASRALPGASDLARLAAPDAPFAAADAHLSLRRGAGGAWLGGDAVHESAGAAGRARAPRTLGLRLGAWRQLRGVTVSVSAGARAAAQASPSANVPVLDSDPPSGVVSPDTFRLTGDSGSTRRLRRWSEVEARLGWARGRVALDAVMGARPRTAGLPGAVWGEGSGVVGVAAGLAVVARAGHAPPTAAAVGGAQRFVALGLRVSPAALWRPAAPPAVRPVASRFAVQPLGEGAYVVRVRVPGARTVELSGDFTGWRPVAMRQVSLDTWELVARIAPGPHRCNVRIDGDAWTPPPGTTAVDDDFNGRVGLIVVG